MAKSFKSVVQDSHRMGLGIPVKTKKPLSQTNTPPAEPPFGFKLRGRMVPAYSRVRLFRHPFANRLAASTKGGMNRFFPRDAGPRVRAPMRFLLSLVVATLRTPIELSRLYHQGDK